ncbi:MAG: hypothetical protein M1814_001460 [Vezdaea aestivalis]|nr:MAG: hypothetical protein M1814_001460 [Vezdaea aestivalis]
MARPLRIQVGIDFGTTFSGIAWAESTHPEHVEIMRNYPTNGQLVGQQVPTEIAYEEGGTTKFSWGYDISFRMKKVKWFKLGLEADHEVLQQLPPGLTAQDVVKDYLSALYTHAMSTLYQRFDRSLMAITKVDFVLTVPAIWSERARSKTEEAARLAGFGNPEHSFQLLSEPEAAALYAFQFTNSVNSRINVGDRIVVCDAGGGTCDLISYDITQTYPFLSVREIAAGTGDYCGSTFIDRNFEKFFASRMGHHYQNLSIVNRQHVVKNFESAKIAFRDLADRDFYVNVPGVGDIPEANVVGGGFEISRDDMRALFDPVIDQVISLIRSQVMVVSQGPERVNVGEKMAGNQLSFFILRNAPIEENQVFKYSFTRYFRRLSEWNDTLICCDLDIPPTRFDNSTVRKLCTIKSDLSHLKKSQFKRKWKGFLPYRVAQYELVMSLKQSNMKFNLEYQGQTYGVSSVEFE